MEIITAFVKVVNGVTVFPDKLSCGASAAKTINANASAPPKIPTLQIRSATGAIIKEIPVFTTELVMFGSKKINTTEIAPKTIHKTSLISRFQMSIVVAMDNITNADNIRIL
jgi:hypothetical protein